MKKIILSLSTVLVLTCQTVSAQEHPCNGAFIPVFTFLKVSTDKEMVEKLHFIYSATTKEEYNTRRSSSNNLAVPDYFSNDYNSSKNTVTKLYEKIKSGLDAELSYDERRDLTQTFSRPEDVEIALNKWGTCMDNYYSLPHLELLNQSKEDSSVTLKFVMKPIARTLRNSVKVLGIFPSSNLVVDSTNLGSRAAYFTDYSLELKRKNLEKATVSISLDGMRVNPVFIPKINNDSVMQEILTDKVLEISYKQNVSGNRIYVTPQGSATQTISFPNQSHSSYKLRLSVKTQLKHAHAQIKSVSMIPSSGYYKRFAFEGISENSNGTTTLLCETKTGSKKMSGKIQVIYTVKELRCVANCANSK
jgi:hypothetical protein